MAPPPLFVVKFVGFVVIVGLENIVIVPVSTKHPVGKVYLTLTFPAVVPVNTPPAEILAVPVPGITDHVPPAVALVKAGVDAPVHTVAAPPAIAAGKGFAVNGNAAVDPAGVVTITPAAPDAFVAIVAVIDVELFTTNVAACPPIVTFVVPMKFVPVMFIDEPAHALATLKLVIVGGPNGCGLNAIKIPTYGLVLLKAHEPAPVLPGVPCMV